MSIRFSTTEDSWVLKRLNWVDPDEVSDYLCPSPVSRPSSLHRGVKRGRASSEPLPSGSNPVGWRAKRVRFSLGEEDKVVGKQVEKTPAGFVWGGPVLRHQGKKLRDVPWSQRVFTPRYVVQCWMEHYRENQTWEVYRTLKYWYDLGTGWGWDEEYFLDEARFSRKAPWDLPSGGCIPGCFCQAPVPR